MITQATSIPPASPPSQVGLVMFEFSGEEYGDEHFVKSALHVDDGNETQNRV